MQKVEAGEIWECETKNGNLIEMLILKQHGNYSTGLKLFDEEMSENCVEVPAMTIRYADAGRPMYSFNDTLVRFVKALKKSDMDRIRVAVAEALGLEIGYTEEEVSNAIDEAREEWEATKPAKVIGEDAYRIEVAKYKTRAEIFENLYKDLLAKVTA